MTLPIYYCDEQHNLTRCPDVYETGGRAHFFLPLDPESDPGWGQWLSAALPRPPSRVVDYRRCQQELSGCTREDFRHLVAESDHWATWDAPATPDLDREQQARELGMGLGVDAYNDAMGWGTSK